MGGVQGVWQSSWFLCKKCGVLFRADADFVPFAAPPAETSGSCPAGGSHDGEGGTRLAVLVGDSGTNVEAGARRCAKCSGFFRGATGSGGVCPQDSQPHQADGDDLLASIDTGNPAAESGWSWCMNCSALFLRAASPSICPGSGGQAHRGINPIVILPPAHLIQYAVPFDRSSFLPHGHACASGAQVDFKVNTKTVIGWYTLCSGTWDASPQSPWQLRFEGGGSDTVTSALLSVRMDPGGGCIIDHLMLQLTASGTETVQQQMPGVGGLLIGLAADLLGSPNPVPCTNFFAGAFDDCEYGDGSNNNGIGTFVTGPQLAAQFWPKREDRIRFDVVLPGGTIANFELDTHE